MPMFFFLPMILWLGMVGPARNDMRPATLKAKAPSRHARR
jgi:hypothetical protein